jgi:hypothetical protein
MGRPLLPRREGGGNGKNGSDLLVIRVTAESSGTGSREVIILEVAVRAGGRRRAVVSRYLDFAGIDFFSSCFSWASVSS